MNSSSEESSHDGGGGGDTNESSLVRLPQPPPSPLSADREEDKCRASSRPLMAATPPRLLGSRSSNCSSSPSSPLLERKPWLPSPTMVLPPAPLLPLPTLNFSVSQVPPVLAEYIWFVCSGVLYPVWWAYPRMYNCITIFLEHITRTSSIFNIPRPPLSNFRSVEPFE
jgi:hypothetical protein